MSVAQVRAARRRMKNRYGNTGKISLDQSRAREAAKVAKLKVMSARGK